MASEAQKNRGYLLPTPLTGYPMICVSFQIPDAPEYRAAVRGHLSQLGRYYTWERSGIPGDKRAVQTSQIFRTLIEETLTFDTACFPDTSGCVEYAPNATIIEYAPNDPFKTPDLVPDGYAFPPWYRATNTTSLTLGTSLGDVVTDVVRTQSAPVIPPASGYPRFRIHTNGTGVVEIHLVKINNGGYAQITTDDDPLTVEFLSLAKDVVSVPPETSDDVIIERQITTPGAHHIDVLFVPLVNDELPFIGQGGALRKVVLCGFDEMIRTPEFQSITDANGCNQLQWRYTDESTWHDLGTPICNGQDGADGAQGIPGADGVCADCTTPPNENTGEVPAPPAAAAGADRRCQVAEAVSKYVIDNYCQALQEYTIGVVNNGEELLRFAKRIQTELPLFYLTSYLPTFAAWVASITATSAANNYTAANATSARNAIECHLYCVLDSTGDLTAAKLSAWKTAINADTGLSFRADLVQFMNNISLAELRTEAYNAVTFNIAHNCSQCACTWRYRWNFDTTAPSYWTLNEGQTVSNGYATTLISYSSPPSRYNAVRINKSFNATLTRIAINADYTAGTLQNTGDNSFGLWGATTYTNAIRQIFVPTAPTFPQVWTGSRVVTGLMISIIAGVRADTINPGGSARIKFIELEGTGTPPAFTGGEWY